MRDPMTSRAMGDKKQKLPASVWVAFNSSHATKPHPRDAFLPSDLKRRRKIEKRIEPMFREQFARYVLAPSKGKRRGR